MNSVIDKLNKALGSDKEPTRLAPGSISHENSGSILQSARDILSHSATGQELLDFADKTEVNIMVVKSRDSFAAQPDPKAVYVSAPAGAKTATPDLVIQLVAALRESFQDTDIDWKRPTFAVGKDRFVKTMVDKRKDSLFLQCVVVQELTNNLHTQDFLDAFDKMGYSSIMEAYQKDLQQQRG